MSMGLTKSPIPQLAELETDTDNDNGARLCFLGVVRGQEDEREIAGIRYSCYEEMVHQQFAAISEEAEAEHGPHVSDVLHRVGFVPVGEVAIRIEVASPHSPRAFELCQWYLKKIKSDAPIWKEIVFDSNKEATA